MNVFQTEECSFSVRKGKGCRSVCLLSLLGNMLEVYNICISKVGGPYLNYIKKKSEIGNRIALDQLFNYFVFIQFQLGVENKHVISVANILLLRLK